jgi:UDP-N-acetylmuramate dehydrogenase
LAVVKTTEQVRLADYTTLHLGGPAARFADAGSQDELVAAVRAADAAAEPVLVLGSGSNLVVADEGFPGLVVLAASAGLEFAADGGVVEVTAAAGQDWDELVRHCVADGLSGVECLSGIPGRVGATPIQNIGAYGQDVAQTITSVSAYDRLRDQIVRLSAAECGFGYRTSAFKRQAGAGGAAGGRGAARGRGAVVGRAGGRGAVVGRAGGRGAAMNPAAATGRFVVLSVTFRLAASPLSAPVRYGELSRTLGVAEGGRVPLADARAAVLGLRRGKGMVLDDADPDTRSAGSFFTNPVIGAGQFADLAASAAGNGRSEAPIPHWPAGDGQVKVSAAWLIERAGFTKGFRLVGEPDGARISTKHALALTNPGDASTASLIRLARQIRDGVRAAFGVELANEPVLVGVTL